MNINNSNCLKRLDFFKQAKVEFLCLSNISAIRQELSDPFPNIKQLILHVCNIQTPNLFDHLCGLSNLQEVNFFIDSIKFY